MFGKLLKYEFRSIGKWYFALNAFVIAIAAILSFTIKLFAQSNSDGLFGVLTNKMLPLTLGLTFWLPDRWLPLINITYHYQTF